jgi:hypothetical protein
MCPLGRVWWRFLLLLCIMWIGCVAAPVALRRYRPRHCTEKRPAIPYRPAQPPASPRLSLSDRNRRPRASHQATPGMLPSRCTTARPAAPLLSNKNCRPWHHAKNRAQAPIAESREAGYRTVLHMARKRQSPIARRNCKPRRASPYQIRTTDPGHRTRQRPACCHRPAQPPASSRLSLSNKNRRPWHHAKNRAQAPIAASREVGHLTVHHMPRK